jgi:hypothetical protein
LRLARPKSPGELQASAKAWAANLGAHLGLMLSKTTPAVGSRSTVLRQYRSNKTRLPTLTRTLAPFHFISHQLMLARERERMSAATRARHRAKWWRRCRPRGHSPARDTHPRVSAPLSSRIVTVPFGGDWSRHVDDPTSGGGRAVTRGPSRSASSLTTVDPAMEER